MTPDEILESYLPLVDFIASVNGKNCEVVLHDLRKLDSSIIAIKNNHITGRTLNDTITDFALDIIYKKKHKNQNYICNYVGKTGNLTSRFNEHLKIIFFRFTEQPHADRHN